VVNVRLFEIEGVSFKELGNLVFQFLNFLLEHIVVAFCEFAKINSDCQLLQALEKDEVLEKTLLRDLGRHKVATPEQLFGLVVAIMHFF
jgi:hypothetical protein